MRRAGVDVELVDRVRPNSPQQTSYGNAGILAQCAVVPVSVPGLMAKLPGMILDPQSPLFLKWGYLPRALPWLSQFIRNGEESKVRHIAAGLATLIGDSVEQHKALATTSSAAGFISAGDYTYLYQNQAAFDNDAWGLALRQEHGSDNTRLSRSDLIERDPNLADRYAVGGLFSDHGWIQNPGRYLAALCDDFLANDGEFWQTEVQDIIPAENGIEVQSQGESRRYDKIILSTGVWSTQLAERLGHKVALESERGYHLHLRGTNITPPNPYMCTDAKMAVTPMDDGVRCAGLVEFAGLKAGSNPKATDMLERSIKKLYPNIRWQEVDYWLGHRPSTTDSLPLLGHSPRNRQVVFAFGLHHIGLTAGPKTGGIAADLIMGRPRSEDLTPYRVGRFD